MNQTEKLMAYSMGALNHEDRLGVEESLLNSKAVLTEFISIKRAIESDEMFQVEPSAGLRAELKHEVAKAFPKWSGDKSASPDGMKINFLKPAFGVAIAAALVATLTSVWIHRPEPTVEHLKSGVSVDAANQSPVSFNFL